MDTVTVSSEPDKVVIIVPTTFNTSMKIDPQFNVDFNPTPQFIEVPPPEEVEDLAELSFDIRQERIIARVHSPLVPPFKFASLANVDRHFSTRYRPRGPAAHDAAAAPQPPTAPRPPNIPPSGDSRPKGHGPRGGGGPSSKTKNRCQDPSISDAPIATTSSGRTSAQPRMMTVSPYYANHIPLAQYGRLSRGFRPYGGRNSIPPKFKNAY